MTCEDVRHGVARTFDRSTHVGGTNYATYLLDVPTQVTPEGLEKPVYAGPGDTRHQPDFDRAVSCTGAHVTFRLRDPEPDFPHVVALPEFAPRKVAADKANKAGDKADDKAGHGVLSSGPYRLEKPWVVGAGGTFVRNEHWDPAPTRFARPTRIASRSRRGWASPPSSSGCSTSRTTTPMPCRGSPRRPPCATSPAPTSRPG